MNEIPSVVLAVLAILALFTVRDVNCRLKCVIDNQKNIVLALNALKPEWPELFEGTQFSTVTFYYGVNRYGPFTTHNMDEVAKVIEKIKAEGGTYGSCTIHVISKVKD